VSENDRLAVGQRQLQDGLRGLLDQSVPHGKKALVGVAQRIARSEQGTLDVLEVDERTSARPALATCRREVDRRIEKTHTSAAARCWS
jgi:hypothetical protein